MPEGGLPGAGFVNFAIGGNPNQYDSYGDFASHYVSAEGFWERFGASTGKSLGNASRLRKFGSFTFQTAKQGIIGGAASVLPIPMPIPKGMTKATKGLFSESGHVGKVLKHIPKGIKRGAKALGGLGAAVIGPAITAYRLSTETKNMGFFQGTHKAGRIIAEEIAWGAGAAVGGLVGTALGGVAGGVVGTMVGGALFAGITNAAIDTLEMPFKVAYSGWKFLGDLGRQSGRAEMGGQVSYANTTQVAATMRQRAMQQMSKSGINARSLLGREASLMHMRGGPSL